MHSKILVVTVTHHNHRRNYKWRRGWEDDVETWQAHRCALLFRWVMDGLEDEEAQRQQSRKCPYEENEKASDPENVVV